MAINRPNIKNTTAHRFATDTAISFKNKNPIVDTPPNNVPSFPGQIVAVRINAKECQLYVGSQDLTRWLRVVG